MWFKYDFGCYVSIKIRSSPHLFYGTESVIKTIKKLSLDYFRFYVIFWKYWYMVSPINKNTPRHYTRPYTRHHCWHFFWNLYTLHNNIGNSKKYHAEIKVTTCCEVNPVNVRHWVNVSYLLRIHSLIFQILPVWQIARASVTPRVVSLVSTQSTWQTTKA